MLVAIIALFHAFWFTLFCLLNFGVQFFMLMPPYLPHLIKFSFQTHYLCHSDKKDLDFWGSQIIAVYNLRCKSKGPLFILTFLLPLTDLSISLTSSYFVMPLEFPSIHSHVTLNAQSCELTPAELSVCVNVAYRLVAMLHDELELP